MNVRKPATEQGLDPRQALELLETRADEIHAYLARHPDVGDAVLQYLAKHGAPAVRHAVAANRAAPARANRLLAEDDEDEVRAELAKKIARLMPGLGGPENAHIMAITMETLECLARDSSVRVRAILAEEIKHLDCVPRSVVRALAHDLESMVAVPILEYSPLLSDADLIEIIAYSRVRERLDAIARRKPLSQDVSEVLVQSLDVSGIAALLVNADARIREETLDRIAEQAAEVESWHAPLVLRVDLSARAICRIAGFVGAAMIELLSQREGLDHATRSHLNRRLRAGLENGAGNDDGVETARQRVAEIRALGGLNDDFLEDAMFGGQREIVVCALSALARIPEDTVRKILASRQPKPAVAMVWRAGLSMRVAFKLQRTVMKLPAHELLPARGGVDFPLAEEEMRWHLGYFGVPA